MTGTYSITGKGNDITLTIDKDICKVAYNALGSYNGCVGVYNYKTGEIICEVSKPTLDPLNPPKNAESGTYINKFLSGTMELRFEIAPIYPARNSRVHPMP